MKLCDFKYYDKIIDYSYYNSNIDCKNIILEYQDYALNDEDNNQAKNILIDDIMYSFISNNDFHEYILNEFNNNTHQSFSEFIIDLYNIYIKEKFKITKESKWI